MSAQVNWVGYKTIVHKEVTRILRIWAQTVLPPAITMTLYFVIFGNLIGRRIGEMGGFDYMQFIVPGLIMMSVITSSYGNMVSSFLVPSLVSILKNCWFHRCLTGSSWRVMLPVHWPGA